jgi:hypothetical protein
MKRAALLLVLLASPASAEQIADDGWMTCDQYLRAIEHSPQWARQVKIWASGYYAGVVNTLTAGGSPFLKNPVLGGPAFADVVATYCERNRDKSFYAATWELVTTIRGKR